ncbi:MAG: hypothetical protein ABEK42_08205, partial [Thiohalorhabdaceae bacterium]
LAYVSFERGRSTVYMQDLESGKRSTLAAFDGINSAPVFSPDGDKLALTLSKDGNPELYVLDLASRNLRRLTRNGAIDTEPSWGPEGERLVFTSDRGGSPQIYRVAASGGKPELVSPGQSDRLRSRRRQSVRHRRDGSRQRLHAHRNRFRPQRGAQLRPQWPYDPVRHTGPRRGRRARHRLGGRQCPAADPARALGRCPGASLVASARMKRQLSQRE